MPWLIGIDEAGYGPNLGPLVVSAVAVRLPPEQPCACPWDLLRSVVRKSCDPADTRLLIADSKKVNTGANGLARLELGVLALLGADDPPPSLKSYIARLDPLGDAAEQLASEVWFTGDSALPARVPHGKLLGTATRVRAASVDAGIEAVLARSLVVAAPRFNALIDQHATKAAAPGVCLTELLAWAVTACEGTEPLRFVIDKQGGRNSYAPVLRRAFPSATIEPLVETAEQGEYRLDNLGRDVTLTVTPRADDACFAVALASMACKYLRELLMIEFNRFWCGQVPGLKPTAGYPSDASRYFAAIQGAMAELGLSADQIWRKR